jgi:hypothetical protein
MKFKSVFVIEVVSIIAVLSLVVIFVEVSPNLISSAAPSIGVYNQREFAKGTLTLTAGSADSAMFNYSTFNPAILVIDLTFQNWQKNGDLTILCNGRNIATFQATSNNPTMHFTAFSSSGWDLVKPPTLNSFTYGNEITFRSAFQNGYEGTFSYSIDVRGSR